MRSLRQFVIGLAIAGFFFASSGQAQQDSILQLGTPPGQPTMQIPMGVVNLNNGNVHLEFPLRTLIQRNDIKVTAKLIYDSKNCYQNPLLAYPPPWNCSGGWRVIASPFQYGDTPFPPYTPTFGNTVQCPTGGPNGGFWYTQRGWTNFTFTDANGTSHLISVQIDNSSFNCQNPPGTPISTGGYAIDGTGYFMKVTLSNTNGPPTMQVWDKSGNLMGAGKDTNGNFLSTTDELGRTYAAGPRPPSGAGSQQFSGSTIQWQNISAYTAFGGTEFNGTISVVSSINLPDGRSYQFTYDQGTTQGHYGQMTTMTLPTGGQVNFTYTNIDPGWMGGDRRVTTLSEAGDTWAFDYIPSAHPGATPTSTTVTAPPVSGVQSQTVYHFALPVSGPNGVTATWSEKNYSGAASGTPLRETDTTLDASSRVVQKTTILENGLSSKVVWTYQPNSFNISFSPNVVSKKEYDFSGNLVRETTASYQTSTAYINFHITDRPLSKKVYGAGGAASGSLLAQTNYTYDSTILSTTSGSAGAPVLGAFGHDDPNYGTSNGVRGNLTSVSEMVSSGTFITTKTNYYNILGELVKVVDGRGNATLFDYSDKWSSGTASCVSGATFAYATTITYPAAVTDKAVKTYNACDGTVFSVQNQNDLNASRPGTVYTYDGLQRVTNVSFPDGGSQQTDYGTAIPQVITKTTAVSSSPFVSISSASTLDGLGRVVQTKLTTDPDGATFVDTRYDARGRVYCVSNPYRSTANSTYGITTQVYDAINRVTQTQPPDYWSATSASSPTCANVSSSSAAANPSNKISTAYSGNTTTVTDQAGKAIKSVTDALGRRTQVFEDPGGLNYETDYTYDALDNLKRVDQKGSSANSSNWRTRTFNYDGLSRLTQAVNPESGTANYSYDNNGNLFTKTSPKPNQTGTATVVATYTYDALNRPTQKSFNDGSTPTVKYGYDGVVLTGCTTAPPTLTDSNPIGNRTAMCDGAGAESWSHDSMARVRSDSRTTNSVTRTVGYTYNLDGSLNTLTYPSARTISYAYSGAGRQTAATDIANNVHWALNGHYAPHGGLSSLEIGDGVEPGAGPVFRTNFYNNRLQLCRSANKASTAPTSCTDSSNEQYVVLDQQFNYLDSNGRNNGNVASVSDMYYGVSASKYYTYDSLNRLQTARQGFPNSPTWQYSYSYDSWGNLLSQTLTGGSGTQLSVTASTKNQIVGFTYDAAGNLLSDGTNGYTYDAENHLLTAAGVTYAYDGDGRRVKKSTGNLYWYGTNADALVISDSAGNNPNEYVFFDGKRYARRAAAGYWNFFHTDHIGNVRKITYGKVGSFDTYDYYPFGGQIPGNPNPPNDPYNAYKFTGKERDTESNLDNFIARYYTSNFGRFMSPDPESIGAENSDAQSWNGYAYARNNPINVTDPDGQNYRLCDVHGQNCQDLTDEQYRQWRNENPGVSQRPSGDLYSDGVKIGSASYYNEHAFDVLITAGNIAAPGVNLAAQGMIVFGTVVAGPLVPLSQYLAGDPNTSGTDVVLASIPLLGMAGGGSTRTALLATVKNQKLRNLVSNLYRAGATVGDGGTADAIRFTKETGNLVGGSDHVIKGIESRTALMRLVRSGLLDANDRQVAKELLIDLQNALSGH